MSKSIVSADNKLTIDLYHGTSSLFLDSIIQNGLGSTNPVARLKLPELSKKIYALCEKYIANSESFQVGKFSLFNMSEQSNQGNLNFQHGETYLTPSQFTANRYATNNKYGSEILSYTIKFIEELQKFDSQMVRDELYHEYSEVFNIMNSTSSPILVKVKNVPISSLKNEHGLDPSLELKHIEKAFLDNSLPFDVMVQQFNFRLSTPVKLPNLKFMLIIEHWDQYKFSYNHHEILPLES